LAQRKQLIRLGLLNVRKSYVPQRSNASRCPRLPGIAVAIQHFGELDPKLIKIISLQEAACWPGHGTYQREWEMERLKLALIWESAEGTNAGLTNTHRISALLEPSGQDHPKLQDITQ